MKAQELIGITDDRPAMVFSLAWDGAQWRLDPCDRIRIPFLNRGLGR